MVVLGLLLCLRFDCVFGGIMYLFDMVFLGFPGFAASCVCCASLYCIVSCVITLILIFSL